MAPCKACKVPPLLSTLRSAPTGASTVISRVTDEIVPAFAIVFEERFKLLFAVMCEPDPLWIELPAERLRSPDDSIVPLLVKLLFAESERLIVEALLPNCEP